jgi:FtsH-binding integral membrane protein
MANVTVKHGGANEMKSNYSQKPLHEHRFLNRVKLLGTAIISIVLLFGAFALADKYHIDSSWVFVAIVSLLFFGVIGWKNKDRFKSLPFALFFVVWMVINGLVFVLVMHRFGWLGWIIALHIELFVFYVSTYLIFGFKPR